MNEDKLQTAENGQDEKIYPLNRREFIQGLGSGIVIFFTIGGPSAQAQGSGKKETFHSWLLSLYCITPLW